MLKIRTIRNYLFLTMDERGSKKKERVFVGFSIEFFETEFAFGMRCRSKPCGP